MALYKNQAQNAVIRSVEFSPVADGNFTFVYIGKPENKDAVRDWLASKEVGQQIIAETEVGGQAVLVTQGGKSKDEMLSAFEAHGDQLKMKQKDRKFNPWAMRGWASIIGQPLQLVSGYLQKGAPDGATITFAVSNMVANVTNIIFGGEKQKDIHRLRHVKRLVSDGLDEYVAPNDAVPDVDESLAALRKEPEPPKSIGGKFYDFMKRNSVTVGEIGLRYFGAFALAFPLSKNVKVMKSMEEVVEVKSMAHWKTGLKQLGQGSFKEAFQTLSNKDVWTRNAGLAYLTGKTIAFTSKIPDPHNPKPQTTLDKVREKYVFRTSSVIETLAAGTIAYDRFFNREITLPTKKFIPTKLPDWKLIPETFSEMKFIPAKLRGAKFRGMKLRGAHLPDFIGGTGGLFLTAGLIIRIFAPFGTKEVDMNEVYAYAGDVLAKTPPEKMPQLMAETAAKLKEHFKDKQITYGELFGKMMGDLYRYHHIALPNLDEKSATPLAAPHVDSAPAVAAAADIDPSCGCPIKHPEKRFAAFVPSQKPVERKARILPKEERDAALGETAQSPAL